jgi:hypothetical protein
VTGIDLALQAATEFRGKFSDAIERPVMNRCVHDLAVVILGEDRDATQDRVLECRCLPFEIMAVATAGIAGEGERGVDAACRIGCRWFMRLRRV